MRLAQEQTWPATPESVPEARRTATAWARALGAAEERLGDIALAVSEACTNAVVHAYAGDRPGSFRVCVEPDAVGVRVLVTDWGHGMRPRHDSPGLGLGLPVIARLTSSLEVRSGAGDEGTTLVMAFVV
jgi:serine/threonine-protein kinase RsbW